MNIQRLMVGINLRIQNAWQSQYVSTKKMILTFGIIKFLKVEMKTILKTNAEKKHLLFTGQK